MMAASVNAKLKFLHWKGKYLTLNLRCLLYIALLQPCFHYAISAWNSKFSKN